MKCQSEARECSDDDEPTEGTAGEPRPDTAADQLSSAPVLLHGDEDPCGTQRPARQLEVPNARTGRRERRGRRSAAPPSRFARRASAGGARTRATRSACGDAERRYRPSDDAAMAIGRGTVGRAAETAAGEGGARRPARGARGLAATVDRAGPGRDAGRVRGPRRPMPRRQRRGRGSSRQRSATWRSTPPWPRGLPAAGTSRATKRDRRSFRAGRSPRAGTRRCPRCRDRSGSGGGRLHSHGRRAGLAT